MPLRNWFSGWNFRPIFSYLCISSGHLSDCALKDFSHLPPISRFPFRKCESRALRIARWSVTWQGIKAKSSFSTSVARKGISTPFGPSLRILTYFFFAPEIYLSRFGTRAITLEYLDSHKSPVTRNGYEEERERMGEEKRGSPLVTSTRVIEKALRGRLQIRCGVRLNSAHEFKTGWNIPDLPPSLQLTQLCVLTFAYSLYCCATRCDYTSRLTKIVFYWSTIRYRGPGAVKKKIDYSYIMDTLF